MSKKSSCLLHPTDDILSRARLHLHMLGDEKAFPCFLVLPGGGYGRIAWHEGAPVAGWLNSLGISAAVLEYTTAGDGPGAPIYPTPQQQALYAMRYLRAHAADLSIDPAHVGVIGFSAGGHLAACVTHGFDREDWLLDPEGNLGEISARPDASILAYAVISSGYCAHVGSYKNLLGPDVTEEHADFLSWEKHVHPQCPPSFIWHTAADTTVPVENSYLLAMALQANGTPHELHVFPEGGHGRGLGTIGDRHQPAVGQWRSLAECWLNGLGF